MASKELANVDKQLSAEASAIASTIGAPSSNTIKIKDKVFKFPSGQIIQDSLDIVIVDYISKNLFYEGQWNPNDPSGPTCWAINRNIAEMRPSENAPNIQSKTDCSECPMNQWGSDGRGKACKNTRSLAVICPSVDGGEGLYTLNISPTGLKVFDAYVGTVAKLYNSPPVKVLTEVTFHPEKSWASLIFSDPRPNEHYVEHFGRREEARTMLEAEPQAGEAT